MLGGMSVRRVIATANMTAGPTQSQVHPDGTHLEALLATAGPRRHLADRIHMRTVGRHNTPSETRPAEPVTTGLIDQLVSR